MSALGTAGPSSSSSDHNVALYTVLVNGQQIDPELAKQLREVKIQSYLRLPDVCTFSLSYSRGGPGEDQPVDSNPFDVGASLEVKLGANDDLTTTSLFKGQIVSLELDFSPAGVELLCRGYDRAHILMRPRRCQTFQNMTSSDIVAKIVQAAGFTPDTDDSGDPHEFMQQNNETDWDFIWRLAECVGFEFVVHDTVAHFRQPVAHHAVQLEWPTALRSFKPRVTATQQARQVTLAAQDPKTKQAITSTASSPNQIAGIGVDRDTIANAFDGADVHVATEPVKTQSEADTLTQALLDKLANGYVAADGVSDGNPEIKAGVAIEVTGLGTKYSGTYRVAAVTHVLRGGSIYETHFASSPSHTLLGSVRADGRGAAPDFGAQLVLGLVTNNDDPDNLGRVRVRYPALGDDLEGTWARIASVSAGNARGLMMLPVVGEEVLVGFEHGDTTRPYVLGSLFNGVDVPGDDLTQNEDGSFALLSDQKIVATAKDVMNLTTQKDLTVTADNMNFNPSEAVTIQGGTDVTINGSGSFSFDAQQSVTIQGQQSITISCGGSSITIDPSGVTISGSAVTLG